MRKSVRNLQACTEVGLIEHVLHRLPLADAVVAGNQFDLFWFSPFQIVILAHIFNLLLFSILLLHIICNSKIILNIIIEITYYLLLEFSFHFIYHTILITFHLYLNNDVLNLN